MSTSSSPRVPKLEDHSNRDREETSLAIARGRGPMRAPRGPEQLTLFDLPPDANPSEAKDEKTERSERTR